MNIKAFFENFFPFLQEELSTFSFTALLDILILSVLFLGIYQFLHDRRAANLLAGLVVLFLAWGVVSFLEMDATAYLLDRVFDVGIIALIVICRDEIRTVLEKVGDRPWRGLKRLGDDKSVEETYALISAVCDAVGDMRKADPKTGESTGALIVLERTTKLGDIAANGTLLDATASATALQAIFYKGAPMHDGAVIIRNNRIAAAGCMLPITTDTTISQDLGSRHRAALGMSEVSDAVIIVVSEETGIVSIACDGIMTREYSIRGLQMVLMEKLLRKRDRTDDRREKNNA
jgi:diadenylate cyclase